MLKDTPGRLTQLLLGLVWLGATMYATHAAITGRGADLFPPFALAVAALPGVIAAMLVAGASIGATAGAWRRSAGARLIAGLALGLLFGVVAGAGIRYAYGDGASVLALAAIAGAASTVGGGLAVLPGGLLKAGLWSTTWVFLTGVVFGVAQPYLLAVLGDGEPANTRVVLVQSLVTGLVAAYPVRYLRVESHRPLWCLVGGALPGAVLFGAEWLTRAGGSTVAVLVHGSLSGTPVLVEFSESVRLRHALIVLAVGGLIAMLVGAMKSLRGRTRPGPRRTGVRASHENLTRIGLDAGQRYGFALAGGYALQAAGFLKRPSEDVDLFMVWQRRDDFDRASGAIVNAYRAAGLNVEVDRRHDTFTRLTVADGVRAETVDLGLDSRTREPVRTPIGPVIHPDDAIANKMRALCERSHASDFIDIDTVLRSGRYDRAALLRLARRSDITFDSSTFAEALAKVWQLDDEEFRRYGLVGADIDALRHRFDQWRAELLEAADRNRTPPEGAVPSTYNPTTKAYG